MDRRNFLTQSGSCAAHLLALGCVGPAMARRVFAAQDERKVIATEKWGRLEEIEKGVWVVVSTPFESQDMLTVCNGGIIQGKDKVLAVEAFMTPKGAKWLAGLAEKLTGRTPTDVIVTHYHGDHSTGHQGYQREDGGPNLWLTKQTETDAVKSFRDKNQENEFKNTHRLDAEKTNTIDLGGREVTIVPRSGHTKSDVTIEVSDPKIVWCGDLFFNRMFPNYGDSFPRLLDDYAADLAKLEKDVTIVPGHGPVADQEAVKIYQDFLGFVQTSAADAFKAGTPVETAAAAFKLPQRLDDWYIWSPDVAKRAYVAWYGVLKAEKSAADQ